MPAAQQQVNANVIPIGSVPVAGTVNVNTPNATSLIVTIDVEAKTSGTFTVEIFGVSATGAQHALLTSASLGGSTGVTTLTVCPVGVLAASANVIANAPVPPTIALTTAVSSPVGITYHVDVATS